MRSEEFCCQKFTDRGVCVHRLRESMEKKDYETAADCISQFRKLETEISQPSEEYQKQVVIFLTLFCERVTLGRR